MFDLRDVDATMVGFWMPEVLDGVNAAGFHFHAITDDVTASCSIATRTAKTSKSTT